MICWLIDSDNSDEKNDARLKRLPVGKNERHEDDSSENEDGILKYKTLLRDIEESEKKKAENDVHLEITWGMGQWQNNNSQRLSALTK